MKYFLLKPTDASYINIFIPGLYSVFGSLDTDISLGHEGRKAKGMELRAKIRSDYPKVSAPIVRFMFGFIGIAPHLAGAFAGAAGGDIELLRLVAADTGAIIDDYLFLNVLQLYNPFDYDKSDYVRRPDDGTLLALNRCVFHSEKLASAPRVFRLTEYRLNVFLKETVVETLLENGVPGEIFIPVETS